MLRPWILIVIAGLLACAPNANRPERALGAVDFRATCDGDAPRKIDDGVALLHHMMYAEADRVFLAATAIDPECAMAHWGMALAQARPWWPDRPDAAELQRGASAIERARQLGAGSERERAWVEAAAAFYATDGDPAARVEAWAGAQARLYEAYPDDVDAAAFHALGRLARVPDDVDDPAARGEIATFLERQLERAPDHPGLLHYLVLACDHPRLAERALEAAMHYAEVSGDLAQAAQLPTRLHARLGRWGDVIEGNLRAAAAAMNEQARGVTGLRFPLATDYLMYAYLQSGWDRRALSVLQKKLARVESYEADLVAARSLAAIPARYDLELGNWKGAATHGPAGGESIDWPAYPAARAVTLFAQGLGAARDANAAGARRAAAELGALRETLGGAAARRAEAHAAALEAWIAHLEGRDAEAREGLAAAADVEDSLAPEPLSPGPVRPLRELLGDLLLEQGRPAEARAAYEACLESAPGRFNSLLGAARAARQGDDTATARRYYQKLVRSTERASSLRPEVVEAREYLGASQG